MGQQELEQALAEELTALGSTRDGDLVSITRTIKISGHRKWVIGTIARSYVPRRGDYKTFGNGDTIACTDCTVEVLD